MRNDYATNMPMTKFIMSRDLASIIIHEIRNLEGMQYSYHHNVTQNPGIMFESRTLCVLTMPVTNVDELVADKIIPIVGGAWYSHGQTINVKNSRDNCENAENLEYRIESKSTSS